MNPTSFALWTTQTPWSSLVLRSLSEVYRCRDDVSGQEETETLHTELALNSIARDRHRYGAYGTLLPELEANDISRYVTNNKISNENQLQQVR